MDEESKPIPVPSNADLAHASDAQLLAHALALDEDDVALGILSTANRELTTIATLCVRSQRGAELDVGELGSVLEAIARRVDVAIELLNRNTRGAT